MPDKRKVVSAKEGGIRRRHFLQHGALGLGAVAGGGHIYGTASGHRTDDETPKTDAMEIRNWHDLDAIRNSLDNQPANDYVLVADLDTETEGYDEHVAAPDDGWEPIGGAGSEVGFRGTFDGQGHEIGDLKIQRPETNLVGLFGYNEGTIERVAVTNTDITGAKRVGSLVGHNEGEIGGVATQGAVTGVEDVGGLVGRNSGGKIADTYAIVTVSGKDILGGLVGTNRRGTVSKSYVAGNENRI